MLSNLPKILQLTNGGVETLTQPLLMPESMLSFLCCSVSLRLYRSDYYPVTVSYVSKSVGSEDITKLLQ